jgi:hypothetical protein
MLYKEIPTFYSDNRIKPNKALCGKNSELLIIKASSYNSHWALKS